MQKLVACCKSKVRLYWFALQALFTMVFIGCNCITVTAQDCPANIDFETGTFDGWTCYTGHVASVNNQNIISLNAVSGPVYNRHTMYTANPGNGIDPFGDFPVNCPNGSGHSIKLGNTEGGNEAEGVSYQFTIPSGKDVYSIIYHYAVVFQDPNHLESEQPEWRWKLPM